MNRLFLTPMRKALFLIMLLCLPGLSFGKAGSERAYQTEWCRSAGGIAEVILPDRTRVDCLTETHAVEVDFARKWAEAVGQALYYSQATGRAPGILLIIEEEGDERFLERLLKVTERLGVAVWTATPEDLGRMASRKIAVR